MDGSLTHQALRSISKDVIRITRAPPEDVRIRVQEGNIGAEGGVIGIVRGPEGTPYAGGYFNVSFSFAGIDYPNHPPKCTMVTKIFHPNISKSGEICVDTLKKAWTRNLGISDVLVTVKCLLIHPNPESALDEEAGKQLLEDYEGYAKMARMMTRIHAVPRNPPSEFSDSTSNASRGQATTTPALTAPAPTAPLQETHAAAQMTNTTIAPIVAQTKPNLEASMIPTNDTRTQETSKPRAPVRAPPRRGLKRL